MKTKKVNKIDITQQGGIISINRNDEGPEWRMDCGKYVDRIKEGKVTPERMANYIAEIICDCLNCKTASAALSDLDELGHYSESTYFSDIDCLE